MSSATSNLSLARSRSLRIPPPNLVKSTTTTTTTATVTAQPLAGPSNITLFLTNLRLLDLDLRPDWPDISAVTFSTKDAQQNQKKRIQCVEWALYQLFALWDPEETQNKLQPFYPPLEPLQSLNLRAALFRSLDQAKKNGILGRDTVLRKTMLDECKGERLDEILAVFSNAVLKKVLQSEGSGHEALAQQLASENFSYSGERTVLSALIVAHKASLSKCLRTKGLARARYQDFSDLLSLNDRRIARRQEQLKQVIEENKEHGTLPQREVYELQDKVQKNWSGNTEWLETILYGDSRSNADGLLAKRFDMIWKNVDAGSIGEVEGTNRVGLLEQLDSRVKDQERRLAKWQDFGKRLSKTTRPSPSKESAPASTVANKIDLGFTRHQAIQIARSSTDKVAHTNCVSLAEYTRLIDNMRTELADVSKPQVQNRPPRQSLAADRRRSLLVPTPSTLKLEEPPEEIDEAWSSASDLDEKFPEIVSSVARRVSLTPAPKSPASSGVILPLRQMKPSRPPVPRFPDTAAPQETPRPILSPQPSPQEPISPELRPTAPPAMAESPPSQPSNPIESENDLADQILNSVSASSPSPMKARHALSLAERTRLSMARTSHSQFSGLEGEIEIADIPRLPVSRPSLAPRTPSIDTDPHADLIERTRKSMAGFEAAQKKVQIERRRSVKEAKTKQRQSSYFPKVEEEVAARNTSAVELLGGDPDYESVFKSRPKIATSPAVSPPKVWEGEDEESV